MSQQQPQRQALEKRPTGITGFDAMAGGGVASGQTTLVMGGPGAGETVFATPSLVAWVVWVAGRRHVLVGDLSDAGLLRDLLERMVA